MRKPSFKQAEWIALQMPYKTNPDDVYDVLLGNITQPVDFVTDVMCLANEYEIELRNNSNGKV